MKFLITVTPGPMPPTPELVKAAREWIEERRDDGTFEAVYAFPQGGGCSIGEVDSHEDLMDQLMDYPLSPFVQYDVTALVEADAAFDRFDAYIEKVSEQMAGAAS